MARKRKGARPAAKTQQKARPQEPHPRVKRPLRKPVRRTPAWVPALATVGVIALLVVVFLAIRYFSTPAAPAPVNTTQTAQVVSTITSLPASELEQVGAGSAHRGVLSAPPGQSGGRS